MKKEEDKLDMLIHGIRQAQPILNDSKQLTGSIMQAIEPKNNRSLPGMLVWIRILTNAAALYLTGLFIYQYRADASESRIAEHAPTQAVVRRMNLDSICMHRSDDGQLNLTKTYLCYLQQNTIKNNRFKSYFQPSKQQEL